MAEGVVVTVTQMQCVFMLKFFVLSSSVLFVDIYYVLLYFDSCPYYRIKY